MIKRINWNNAFTTEDGTFETCVMPLGFMVSILTNPLHPGLWGWKVSRHGYRVSSDAWAVGVEDSRAAAEEACQTAWDKIASRVLEGHKEIASPEFLPDEAHWVVGGPDHDIWFCPMCGKSSEGIYNKA